MATHTHEFLPELGETEQEFAGESEVGVPGGFAEAAAQAALAAVAGEGEDEFEDELNPARRWYPDAMLEHLAHAATEAESEDEAGEAFLPLIPLVAAKLLPLAAKAAPLIARSMPQIMRVVSRVTPQLTRGVMNVARTMFRSPASRRLLRTLPTIAQRTVGQIARQVAAGQPLTARGAVQALAQQTATILRQPTRVARAVARSGAFDGQFHRVIPATVPTGTVGAARAATPRCGATRPKGRGCRCGCVCGGCGCR